MKMTVIMNYLIIWQGDLTFFQMYNFVGGLLLVVRYLLIMKTLKVLYNYWFIYLVINFKLDKVRIVKRLVFSIK